MRNHGYVFFFLKKKNKGINKQKKSKGGLIISKEFLLKLQGQNWKRNRIK